MEEHLEKLPETGVLLVSNHQTYYMDGIVIYHSVGYVNRPYLIRAIYEWIVDNGLTPYLMVDVEKLNDGDTNCSMRLVSICPVSRSDSESKESTGTIESVAVRSVSDRVPTEMISSIDVLEALGSCACATKTPETKYVAREIGINS